MFTSQQLLGRSAKVTATQIRRIRIAHEERRMFQQRVHFCEWNIRVHEYGKMLLDCGGRVR
jgi:hypothetical protein